MNCKNQRAVKKKQWEKLHFNVTSLIEQFGDKHVYLVCLNLENMNEMRFWQIKRWIEKKSNQRVEKSVREKKKQKEKQMIVASMFNVEFLLERLQKVK